MDSIRISAFCGFPFCKLSSSFMAYFSKEFYIFMESQSVKHFSFLQKHLFIWQHQDLGVAWEIFSPLAACRIFSCSMGILSCGMQTCSCGVWDLVPWPGVTPRPPICGELSLSHCTTREVPMKHFSYRTFSLLLEEKEQLLRLELFHFPVFWYVYEYKFTSVKSLRMGREDIS